MRWISFVLFFSLIGMACQEKQASKSMEIELSQTEKEAYLEKGKAIANATFTVLSGNLKQALQSGGVPAAIDKCQVVALPIVDSLSTVHQAKIRRTSLKVRNPKDVPNAEERQQLEKYAQQAEWKPEVKAIDAETVAFYAPIVTQPLCLNCHGQIGETLSAENGDLIKKYYPEDEATGYANGDLRGMWSITFAKEQTPEKIN